LAHIPRPESVMELFEKMDALVDRDGLTAVVVALRNKVGLMVSGPPDQWTLKEREQLVEVQGLLTDAADELGGTDLDPPGV
jgi:hypothetical protein